VKSATAPQPQPTQPPGTTRVQCLLLHHPHRCVASSSPQVCCFIIHTGVLLHHPHWCVASSSLQVCCFIISTSVLLHHPQRIKSSGQHEEHALLFVKYDDYALLSVKQVSATGLINRQGEYNCFLNVIIQVMCCMSCSTTAF
jgi:hypothetical protein